MLDLEPFIKLGLGHLVVRLELVRVLKRVGNHVQTILVHARICPLTILVGESR